VFGTQEKLTGGATVTVDENYIRESMMVPNAKLVEGFAPVMPAFAGRLSDDDVDALTAFIKSLK
jgi:cytochrome c oxidase subunit 2